MGESRLFTLKMTRTAVFVIAAAFVIGAQAGCEWYKNCGACVADAGCGWCSNDPMGVGSGSLASGTLDSGKSMHSTDDRGAASNIAQKRDNTKSMNGVAANWLVNVRGQ